MENIYNLVKRQEKNLIHGKPIQLGKYATHDHLEKISMIDAYLNSQHISGPVDSLGREKPFFNIVLAAVYSWYKTTDVDRKHITFRPRNKNKRLKALIGTILLRKWMQEHNFGHWLNKWGWNLSAYGSCPSKFIEKEGNLFPGIVPWERMICDPVDFEGNMKVEKLYFTPAQLRQQSYDQDKIEQAIMNYRASRKTLDGKDIDISNEYIGIYEAHGELPLSLLTGKPEDEKVYRQQMHVLFIDDNEEDLRGSVTLYSGKEAKDPYHLAHLIEREGRALSAGAVEGLFEPQWMVNHSAKQVKDQMDLASKLITQTSDPNFLGRNLETDVDTGSVLIHAENQPLTPLNNQSHDIPQIMSYLEQWKQLAKDISGAHETVTGQQMKAGTPYRLGAMLNIEARGMFDLMRENKGLYLEDIMKKYVLPYFKKTLKNSDEVIALLDGEELETFDDLTMPAKLEKELMMRLSKDHIPSSTELMGAIEMEDAAMGSIRTLRPSENEKKTWAEYFKDFDMDAIEVEVTGESRDKDFIFQALNSVFETLMTADPQRLQDPNVKKVFNKLMDEIGPGIISPLQISSAPPMAGTTGGEMPFMGAQAGEVGAPTKVAGGLNL